MSRYTILALSVLAVSTSVSLGRKQYKKYPKQQIVNVAEGCVDEAMEYWTKYLRQHPDDLESHYGLAICHAQRGKIEDAMAMARRGVEKGLPFGRLLAGPRGLLKPLTESEPFKAWAEEQSMELIHGPMLGSATDTGVTVWMRTWHEADVVVLLREEGKGDFTARVESAIKTAAAVDFTGRVVLGGVRPSTRYEYKLKVAGNVLPTVYDFQTLPAEGKPAKFTIMFGGGSGYTPWKEHMWNVIDGYRPRAYMALGDNVYYDTLNRPGQRYCYYRRQSRPEYRNFVSSTPVFAIWDDHDFKDNDCHGGPGIQDWKREVWQVFKENWANPAYGSGEEVPGCWFSCRMADVDFILVDGRMYRDPKGGSMLGPEQKQWLLDCLKRSAATFKVLCVDVPMTPGVKPGSKDTWDGFDKEREAIFRCIAKNRIEGVFIISADRHRSDAYKMDRPGAYPLYEFQSSKLTNVHTHKLIKKCLFGYNEKCSFGLLRFDTTLADPQVTYDVINIDNEKKHSLTIKKSELSFN